MDHPLRVAAPDMAAFDAPCQKPTEAVAIKDVTSHFAIERIKASTVHPVDTANR